MWAIFGKPSFNFNFKLFLGGNNLAINWDIFRYFRGNKKYCFNAITRLLQEFSAQFSVCSNLSKVPLNLNTSCIVLVGITAFSLYIYVALFWCKMKQYFSWAVLETQSCGLQRRSLKIINSIIQFTTVKHLNHGQWEKWEVMKVFTMGLLCSNLRVQFSK